MIRRMRKSSSFFHTHTHSHNSALDGTADVRLIVQKAARMNQPALALTDHGNMGGVVKLYQECKAQGLAPFPGVEGYLIDPLREDWETPAKGKPVGRYHFGLLALNEDGYIALVKFVSMTHTRPRFSRFPRCTLADLVKFGKEHGKNVVFTTGCYFGLIQQSIARGQEDFTDRYLKLLKDAFPHLFIEVQNHHICFEDQSSDPELIELDDVDITNILFEKADEHSLPIIAAQDSHYLDQKHQAAHKLMKQMVYAGNDDGFPGDTFHLASGEWVAEHYEQEQWEQIEEGYAELLDLNEMSIAPLDNYKPRVPTISKTPYQDIRYAGLKVLKKYFTTQGIDPRDQKVYEDRFDYELDVIKKLGMSAYFVITADMVRWCHEKKFCVEARGSANGSLVCFTLGITQVDPIIWGGMFERFLSLDRTKPPDVDLDIEDEARPQLVQYLLQKYGAVQIGTWGLLGSTVDKDTGEEKGSVLQTWLSWKRRECDKIAADRIEKVGDRHAYSRGIFNRKFGDVRGIEDVARISMDEYNGLRQMIEMNSIYKSYGVHAGGILLSGDDIKIEDYIPTMLVASSDTRVSQYNMDDVEAFGLLKMDVLGQASLRMMKLCQELIGRKEPSMTDPTDFSWIEYDDPEACKHLRNGRTNTGIFHFEGYTKAKGGREMKVKSTEDAVMVQALYMPGAMNSGEKDKYIRRRFSAQARREVTYISKEFEQALERTYGTVIFQEQVIDIMRNLGMDIAGINKFFKVVKDSGRGAVERNRERMAEVRKQFEELCRRRGVADVDAAWEQTAGFVSYGFNRAHASGYGIRSYRTAYLKAYHPTEFMAALLQTWAGRDKETLYVREARRMEIRLLPPDVNVSGPLWTMEREGVIRRGLLSIKGVGAGAAENIAMMAPFVSMEDMIARVPGRAMTGGKQWLETGQWSGIVRALYEANALDTLMEKSGY